MVKILSCYNGINLFGENSLFVLIEDKKNETKKLVSYKNEKGYYLVNAKTHLIRSYYYETMQELLISVLLNKEWYITYEKN